MDNDKIVKQKQVLAQLKQEFENESNPDGQMWTEDDIRQLLRKLPLAMFNQGNKVVEALVEFKTAKQNLKKEYSKKLLEANYDPDLKAANERKAWAESHPDYVDAEQELIIKEGNYKAAELHYSAYESLYTAVKKASGMVTEQNRNQLR